MRTVVIFTLALCCAPALARAQTPQTPEPQKETPRPAAPVSKPTASITTVKLEPIKVIPDEVFERELKDLDGGSFYLSNFRGQVFVVNLWATWCGPCRMEIPELNKIYEEYAARGVEFVGLTSESPATDAEKVRKFAEEFKMKHRLGWLDAETAKTLMAGHYSIPQTFVVGADGRVVMQFRGFSERIPPMLRAAIERALNPLSAEEPSPAPPAASAPPAVRP
jgi:thiol-disulfide isomerase/thioredoxin